MANIELLAEHYEIRARAINRLEMVASMLIDFWPDREKQLRRSARLRGRSAPVEQVDQADELSKQRSRRSCGPGPESPRAMFQNFNERVGIDSEMSKSVADALHHVHLPPRDPSPPGENANEEYVIDYSYNTRHKYHAYLTTVTHDLVSLPHEVEEKPKRTRNKGKGKAIGNPKPIAQVAPPVQKPLPRRARPQLRVDTSKVASTSKVKLPAPRKPSLIPKEELHSPPPADIPRRYSKRKLAALQDSNNTADLYKDHEKVQRPTKRIRSKSH